MGSGAETSGWEEFALTAGRWALVIGIFLWVRAWHLKNTAKERRLRDLVNQVRKSHGRPPL